MELSEREVKNLLISRQWTSYIEENLPKAFMTSLKQELREVLVEMLMHFELWGGVAKSIHSEGSLIVTQNDRDLVEQIKNLLKHNIQHIYIVSAKGNWPDGKDEQRLISNLHFASGRGKITVGCDDEKRKTLLWKLVQKDRRKLSRENFDKIIDSFSSHFLLQAESSHVVKNIVLFYRCMQDINVKVELQYEYKGDGEICVALANRRSSKTGFFLNLIKVIQSFDFKLVKAQSIYVASDGFDEKALTHFYVLPPENQSNQARNNAISRMLDALAMVQWFEFENTFNKGYIDELNFSLHHSILLRSMEEFTHQMLVHVNENVYTPHSIHEAMARHPDICEMMVNYFVSRFNPVLGGDGEANEEVYKKVLSMISLIDSGIAYNDKRRKNILLLGLKFLKAIQKTNYYVIRRSALSFRVCPDILDEVDGLDRESVFPEKPFAIYFIKGKNFIGFNIRFRDLARGGVRTLIPLDPEKREQQHKEVFRECYNLAYTQQFKNKDIPEGGSKSVVFVKLHSSFERDLASDYNLMKRMKASKGTLEHALADKRNTAIRRQLFDAQQSFCDTLLDLLIWDEENGSLKNNIIKDKYGKEELVFLGPDENMTNPMIEWISDRSNERGYRVGSAFMSGKQGMGINHKEYGVTSLGVHEYLKVGLDYLGMNSKAIRVKVSGGPDGDVAGNEIVNLIQDFGRKLKLLSVQDGTGLLFDPKGINAKELLRLFKQGLGVAKFNTKKLKDGGFLLLMHQRKSDTPGVEQVLSIKCIGEKIKEEWVSASEANTAYSQFLLNLETDVFLPCGGRPRTLSKDNWEDFLLEDGSPSAKLIVEGANLYLDQTARSNLEEKGVVIIKDASANKCGVICSSYEIMSGLLLSPKDFQIHKEQIVKEVLVILKDRAQKEARLLMHCEEGVSRIKLTEDISNKINSLGDQILQEMQQLRERGGDVDAIFKLVSKKAIPKTLLKYGQRKLKTLPELYRDALVASFVASSLVYKYGIQYQPSLMDSLKSEIQKGLFETDDPH